MLSLWLCYSTSENTSYCLSCVFFSIINFLLKLLRFKVYFGSLSGCYQVLFLTLKLLNKDISDVLEILFNQSLFSGLFSLILTTNKRNHIFSSIWFWTYIFSLMLWLISQIKLDMVLIKLTILVESVSTFKRPLIQ